MFSLALLLAATICYAGYNLLIKQSSGFAGVAAITTITATITLQLTALMVSLVFLLILRMSGV